MKLILRCIKETLPRFSYRLGNEAELHEGIAQVLDGVHMTYQREFIASPQDRYDFLIDPGIVIEAKVQGSLSRALEQVKRYAKRDEVSAVVLVTTKLWADSEAAKSTTFHDKPIIILRLKRSSF